jgi:LysM repeat protein
MSFYTKLFTFFLISINLLLYGSPCDSIGIEKRNGKTFILYKIEPGQTLFSISKKYAVKIEEIVAENPECAKGLKAGMIIRIPKLNENLTNENNKLTSSQNITNNNTYHIVEKGQSLYSIAKQYDISVEQLKKWNNLAENTLTPGMQLIVKKLDEGEKEIVQHVHKLKTTSSQLYTSGEGILDTLKVRKLSKHDGVNLKIIEYGVAETTELGLNINQYEALHKTAPKGTFITIQNLANDEKVFVRVVGKMPEEHNPKTIIMISPKAQRRLYSASILIPVEITYVQNE